MNNIEKLIRSRRSVRTFEKQEVDPAVLEKLIAFAAQTTNPYNIPVEFKLLDAKRQPLNCPVANGTDLFLGARVKRTPHMEEAFGYSFEMLVLYARSLGLGTVWVGGTMDRPAFERAMALEPGERMPCMSPLGYPAGKMSVQEKLMRKAIKADSREPFESLFFDGGFGTPLTLEKAGALAFPLEMVRWAPSAVNKQPWRAVTKKNAVHFYLRHTGKFISESVGDMQKIDMGIALCHFALAAKEAELKIHFCINNPGIPAGADCEYIASYLLS